MLTPCLAFAPAAPVALAGQTSVLIGARPFIHRPAPLSMPLRTRTAARLAPCMQDPSKQDAKSQAGPSQLNAHAPGSRPPAAWPASAPEPIWQVHENLRSLAFDVTTVDDALWLALLSVCWPFLLVLNVSMSTMRMLEEFIVLLQHLYGKQDPNPSIPTVYMPRHGSPLLLPMKSSTSEAMDFDLLQLEVRLKKAVNDEDYATASAVQATIKALTDRQTDALAKELLKGSWRMQRREVKNDRGARGDAGTLQSRLEAAVCAEDYAEAAQLQKQMQQVPDTPRADVEWLVWDVKQRASQMFITDMLKRQDPIQNLTMTLEELVDMEDYETAAHVHDELQELRRLADQQALLKTLAAGVQRQRELAVDRRITEVVRQEIRDLRHMQLLKNEIERQQGHPTAGPPRRDGASPHLEGEASRFEKFSQLQRMHFNNTWT
jgi:protein-arginine kinase activator protein McsA